MKIKRYIRTGGHIYRMAATSEKEVERLMLAVLPGTKFAGKAFAVGGYVRDEVMGKDSKDLDIVVEMPGGARALTHHLFDIFGSKISRPRQLGAGYPIWFIAFKDDVDYKGQTYYTKGAELDFADSQKEAFPDPESRQRVTEYGDVDDDVRRRDFTVNMLMKDLTTGEMVDLSGVSIRDIEKGVLRTHPDVSPDQTFADDPLRMLRLIRFMVKYGWTADPETVAAVKRNAQRIEIISGERIQGELVKIMQLGKLAAAMRFMSKTGLLRYVMPEIEELRGVEQDRLHHAEGDVFEHTMSVLEKAKPTIEHQLAALLHDAGKPATQEFVGERIKFLGHEKISGEITEAIMRRLKFDNATIKKVRNIVENHMRPHASKDWSNKAVRKFIRDVGEEVEDILDLADIDAQSSLGPDLQPQPSLAPRLRERIREVETIPVAQKPVLSGKEIMQLLGIKPGPEVGKITRWLQEVMDEYAGEGRELTKDEAVELLLKEFG